MRGKKSLFNNQGASSKENEKCNKYLRPVMQFLEHNAAEKGSRETAREDNLMQLRGPPSETSFPPSRHYKVLFDTIKEVSADSISE